jgi:GNAT superfamily N-acetyltransferase
LLREQGSILAMMHSCTQVLGQLLNRDHDHMLLLLRDGDLAALALVEGGNVHDLLTKPAHLAAGTRGAGSALMEYIVRRAKAKGQRVSLIPLDSAALRVYVAWGFTGNMSGMVLLPEAADRLLRRYTNFAAHVFQ